MIDTQCIFSCGVVLYSFGLLNLGALRGYDSDLRLSIYESLCLQLVELKYIRLKFFETGEESVLLFADSTSGGVQNALALGFS